MHIASSRACLRGCPRMTRSRRAGASAQVKGEYGLSEVLLGAGYNLATLMARYAPGVDWRDRAHWHCNDNAHPSRHGTYDRISMHPFETMFVKARRDTLPNTLMAQRASRTPSSWRTPARARMSSPQSAPILAAQSYDGGPARLVPAWSAPAQRSRRAPRGARRERARVWHPNLIKSTCNY